MNETISEYRSVCSDGSDVRHCLHKVYTGCFLSDSDGMGLRLADCDECLCELRDQEEGRDGKDGGDAHVVSGDYRPYYRRGKQVNSTKHDCRSSNTSSNSSSNSNSNRRNNSNISYFTLAT